MDSDELLRHFPAHRGRLIAALSRLVGPAEAEDLVQETLLRALPAVGGFRGEAALGTWLHRIALNIAYDRLRLKSASLAAPETAAEEPGVPDAGPALDQRRMSGCVRDVLGTLSPRYRDVLVKADMLDRTAAEIAGEQGISAGNAKITLHRARRAMKKALEERCSFHRRGDGVLCCSRKAGP